MEKDISDAVVELDMASSNLKQKLFNNSTEINIDKLSQRQLDILDTIIVELLDTRKLIEFSRTTQSKKWGVVYDVATL